MLQGIPNLCVSDLMRGVCHRRKTPVFSARSVVGVIRYRDCSRPSAMVRRIDWNYLRDS
jgi:hypothetical protein